MAGDQTGELELAGLGKSPDHLVRFFRRDAPRIRIVVVLHLWVHRHRFRVLQVLLGRRKYEFVVKLAAIINCEFDLLAFMNFDVVRDEEHSLAWSLV